MKILCKELRMSFTMHFQKIFNIEQCISNKSAGEIKESNFFLTDLISLRCICLTDRNDEEI